MSMIRNMTHLEVLDCLARELQDVLIDYNRRASGQTDESFLVALRLEQNTVLAEVVRKQRRHLRLMNGEKIEPEIHYAEAVLIGTGSGEM
jgi:hypothetical protein